MAWHWGWAPRLLSGFSRPPVAAAPVDLAEPIVEVVASIPSFPSLSPPDPEPDHRLHTWAPCGPFCLLPRVCQAQTSLRLHTRLCLAADSIQGGGAAPPGIKSLIPGGAGGNTSIWSSHTSVVLSGIKSKFRRWRKSVMQLFCRSKTGRFC